MVDESAKIIRVHSPYVRIDDDELLGINKIEIKHEVLLNNESGFSSDKLFNYLSKNYSNFKGLFFLYDCVGSHIYNNFPNNMTYVVLSHISNEDFTSLDAAIDVIESSRICIPIARFSINPDTDFNHVFDTGSSFDVDISHYTNTLLPNALIDVIFARPGFFDIDHMLYLDDHIYIGYYHDANLLVFDFDFSNDLKLIDVYNSANPGTIISGLTVYELMCKVYK